MYAEICQCLLYIISNAKRTETCDAHVSLLTLILITGTIRLVSIIDLCILQNRFCTVHLIAQRNSLFFVGFFFLINSRMYKYMLQIIQQKNGAEFVRQFSDFIP